jgi:hypothetical protein
MGEFRCEVSGDIIITLAMVLNKAMHPRRCYGGKAER